MPDEGPPGARKLNALAASLLFRRQHGLERTCRRDWHRASESWQSPPVSLEKTQPTGAEDPAFVHPSSVADTGAHIAGGTKIWHFCHISAGARIGEGCVLGQNVYVGPGVVIGAGCKIQNNVSLVEGVVLEEQVFVGPSAVFTNVLRPRAFLEQKDCFVPTLIQRGATIGANATVLCGTTVGPFAMIGSGAVVLRDVPAHALVVGNPARQVGWVDAEGCRLAQRPVDTAQAPGRRPSSS